MGELKVYRDPKDGPAYREFYEKAEADKVIAYHKYKRCLGMVKCCMADNHTLSQVTLNEVTNHLQWLFNENFFVKWAARWSKIADKFKEAK